MAGTGQDAIDLTAGRGIAVREFKLKPAFGFADYLLYVDRKALGAVEAKADGTLTGVEAQSAKYAAGLPDNLPAHVRPQPFLIESNGSVTYFTNGLDPRPRSRRAGLQLSPSRDTGGECGAAGSATSPAEGDPARPGKHRAFASESRRRRGAEIDKASRRNYSNYMSMRELKVTRIGNSRGVRLPAMSLKRYQIGDIVMMEERSDGILLRPAGPAVTKLSWAETARAMAASGEDWSAWDALSADGLDQIPWEPGKAHKVAEPKVGYEKGRPRAKRK